VKITVDIDELDSSVRTSHAVADYVRAMLKVRSLRRAVGEALLEAERYRFKLKDHQLVEAERLIDGAVPPPSPKLRRRPMGRRTARGGRREGDGPVARGDRAEE
jgi:hypothetical protein